ncbi:MAG: hypothetical protein OSJ45_12830 [Lachnospiraceae bacterium]|nr:hypothetical protein [Lachnospiraceae bacterium]
MVKKEFLDILRESLAGNVPASEVEENIRYYKDYIENEAESEEEALKQLGDPHLIARTIIDGFKASKGPMADFYTEQARNEYSSSVFDDDADSSEGSDNIEYKYKAEFGHKMKWYEKLVLILFAIGIISLVLFIGRIALAIVFRIVIPVILLFIIIKFITDYFRRG